MLPKIMLFLSLLTVKMVFPQMVYSTPTYPYSTAVSSTQSYPSNLSPSATISTAVPVSSSPTTLVSSPPTAISAIPSKAPQGSSTSPAEAKAYFLPGPIPDPKVTILSDMPSVLEGKPRLISSDNIIELNRATDPGFIEVIGKFCEPMNTKLQGDGEKPVLPTVKENTVSPVKRLTMACSKNEPVSGAESWSYLQNEQVICPGISKIDVVLLNPALAEKKINNPIEYEGLLDGFFTYLEV